MRAVSVAERPELTEPASELTKDALREYNSHGDVLNLYWLWTQMALPESGDYWFPGGLACLTIDRDADSWRYWEPNVWMRHAV